jgi:2'-5' RNA ligase
MRLFVAVELPQHVKERLAEVVAELSACRADVRWVSDGALHLTLKFLGSVDARDLGGVETALQRVAAAARPTRGRVRSIGSFPHPSRPRVLWAGVEPDGPALGELHGALDEAMGDVGFEREKRRFHPHVTLARVRGPRGLPELREAMVAREGFDAGTFQIDALTLFRSELRRDGARHTALSVQYLAGG